MEPAVPPRQSTLDTARGKHKGGECNGDANANTEPSMHSDDYECDCDACLLGFDDSHPGEVREGPPIKRTAVNVIFYNFFLSHKKFFSIFYMVIMWCCYNTVNFLQSHHNGHPIACPHGQAMGCLLWFLNVIYVPPQSLQYCMPWHVILDHTVTAVTVLSCALHNEVVINGCHFYWSQ